MVRRGATSWLRIGCLASAVFATLSCGERRLTAILPADLGAGEPPPEECPANEGQGAGPLPPMGWNGWNTFGCGAELDQAKFRANAEALVSTGLAAAGYEYMNLDDCWQSGRDASGQVQVNSTRFPDGLAALGSFVHDKGLKFGLNSTVNGCKRPELVTPGSRGHEAQDAAAYAGFGIDFVKYNSCGADRATTQTAFEAMRDALAQTGRPMLLSLVDAPFKYWHTTVGQLWRTLGDIGPNWQGILDVLDVTTPLAAYAGQGGYNDADMLWIGNPSLSDTESRAYFSAWAILASPLLAGNDLTTMSSATQAILGQKDVIALNQDPLRLQAALLATRGNVMVLAKPLAACGARGVVLLNRGDVAVPANVSWTELGLSHGSALVRDLWSGAESSPVDGFDTNLDPHGAVALTVTGQELPLPRGEVYLSDLTWTYSSNGWGPTEKDREVGEMAAGDGQPLTLDGRTYAKGLGVNSPALVRYRLGKRCHELRADIGIDDVTGGGGSAVFQVWADGEKMLDSGPMYGSTPPQSISVDLSGKSELRLWVGELDDIGHDHADWADARLRCDP